MPENTTDGSVQPTTDEDRQWIAEAAYFKALARGFTPQDDYKDWMEAKRDYENYRSCSRKSGLVIIKPT